MGNGKIILPASFDRASLKKDGSMNLGFGTYILSPEAKGIIVSLYGKEGFLMFKEGSVIPEEKEIMDKLDADLAPPKSQSQRLRGILWHVWEKNHKNYVDFDSFYMTETERIINHYKDKLDK